MTRAISWLARVSMRLNRARGGKFKHLTLCAELWVLDRRLPVLIIDAMMLLIYFERHHCRKQYLTHGLQRPPTEHNRDPVGQDGSGS